MSRFKLTPFRVRINKVCIPEVDLSNIDGRGTSFINLLRDCLADIRETRVLRDCKKTVSIEQMQVSEREIYGIAKSGGFGLSADFFDTETDEVIENARKIHHSEIYPYFFLFYFPQNDNKGFLILQTFGTSGIKTILESALKEKLSNNEIIISFDHLISRDLLEQIDRSRLLEIELIRYDVPMDVAGIVHDGRPEEIREKRIFQARRNMGLHIPNPLKNILSERDAQYYEVLNERYDEIKTLIEGSNGKRTLTFGRNNKYMESMPLDVVGEDGFPKLDQTLLEARSYLQHLINSGG